MGQSPQKSRTQEVPMPRCGLAAALHRGRSWGSWGGGELGGGPCIRGGGAGLPAPPLSLRSFKYATKREDRARGAGLGRQNTGEEEVRRDEGVQMDQRGRHRAGCGQGQSLRKPPPTHPPKQRPQKEPQHRLMSVWP